MEELDRIDWQRFISKNTTRITHPEVQLIAQLHSKYYNHRYTIPCSCSPNIIQGWVNDLNGLYENQ